MKVVIFAGGIGSRITEESHLKPKPMIEIGDKPILWHIMKIYSTQGFNEFIICLGYKGYVIKEYFFNYFLHNSDVTINLNDNNVDIHYTKTESFKVTLVDTGPNTKTAGRLKKIQEYIGNEEFMLTYGDGVADIDLVKLLEFHHKHGKIATMSIIQLPSQFGGLKFDENSKVIRFKEKSKEDAIWINGGFFVLKPEVFKYLDEKMDDIMWEDSPLENLTKDNQLFAFKHEGFWKCMDAMRDKIELDKLWETNQAKWKIW
jgi:glucose-1-phosphate cytidylyltransferase